jgi:hypothetical protein
MVRLNFPEYVPLLPALTGFSKRGILFEYCANVSRNITWSAADLDFALGADITI